MRACAAAAAAARVWDAVTPHTAASMQLPHTHIRRHTNTDARAQTHTQHHLHHHQTPRGASGDAATPLLHYAAAADSLGYKISRFGHIIASN